MNSKSVFYYSYRNARDGCLIMLMHGAYIYIERNI